MYTATGAAAYSPPGLPMGIDAFTTVGAQGRIAGLMLLWPA